MLLPQDSSLRAVTLPTPATAGAGLAPGTLILTQDGPLPVEHLFAGDRVAIMGGGFATLRGVERLRAVGAEVVVLTPGAAPGLRAGLTLAADHPVLLADWRAQVVFGQPAVLSRAGALADHPGATCERRPVQTLIRLEFDAPQIINANGLWLGCGTRRRHRATPTRPVH